MTRQERENEEEHDATPVAVPRTLRDPFSYSLFGCPIGYAQQALAGDPDLIVPADTHVHQDEERGLLVIFHRSSAIKREKPEGAKVISRRLCARQIKAAKCESRDTRPVNAICRVLLSFHYRSLISFD